MTHGRLAMMQFEIIPPNPPNQGIMFVNHSLSGRSGHLGHALVEYAPGKILAFYPNCSEALAGHNGDGWMEYKRTEDGGYSWSNPIALDYSRQVYDETAGLSAICEKAVSTPDGTIVLFSLICDITKNASWTPHGVPTYIRSSDGGYSWTEARQLGGQRGRVYDAIYHEGSILALEFCNDAADARPNAWTGNRPEHVYALYDSTDNGETFTTRSLLPFDTVGRGYGSMAVLHDGSVIVYVYNIADEERLDYVISPDGGFTWGEVQTAFFEKKIRNPQMTAFKQGFVLHGRSGHFGAGSGHLVLYTSPDGVTWDAGTYLCMQEAGHGAYSNSLVVRTIGSRQPNRLLIQSSHAYDDHKTNVLHWWLT